MSIIFKHLTFLTVVGLSMGLTATPINMEASEVKKNLADSEEKAPIVHGIAYSDLDGVEGYSSDDVKIVEVLDNPEGPGENGKLDAGDLIIFHSFPKTLTPENLEDDFGVFQNKFPSSDDETASYKISQVSILTPTTMVLKFTDGKEQFAFRLNHTPGVSETLQANDYFGMYAAPATNVTIQDNADGYDFIHAADSSLVPHPDSTVYLREPSQTSNADGSFLEVCIDPESTGCIEE